MAQGQAADPVWDLVERDADRVLRLTAPRRAEALNMSLARDVGGWLVGQLQLGVAS